MDMEKAALSSWSKSISSPGPNVRLTPDLLVCCLSYQLEVSSVRTGILGFIFIVFA